MLNPKSFCESTPHPSIAYFTRRVYPLNLKTSPSNDLSKKKSFKVKVPEFAKEFIKDSTRSQSNKKVKRPQMHNRSVSYTVSVTSKPEKINKTEETPVIPLLNYRDFQERHSESKVENRYFKPQSIQLNKRAKIVLYSAKPIVIDPSVYLKKKSSVGNDSSRADSVENVGFPAGLTYGEKIVKLKSIVESAVFS